jgi:hypothetical protein
MRLLPAITIRYFARASACCARFTKPGSFVPALALLFLSAPAWAGSGALAVKTMREPLDVHEAARGLILPKGWLELNLAYDHHVGTGAWTDSGDGMFGHKDPFTSAKWRYMTESATVRYGLGPRVETWWRLPFHEARLINDDLGTDTRDMSLGDPSFGATFLLAGVHTAPVQQLAVDLAYKGPAGQESPGTYIGGPLNFSQIIFTTGTPDLSVGLAAKQSMGPLGIVAHAAYLHRFSAVVQYLVELKELQFLGRIKPGDQLLGDLGVQLQAGPVCLEATGKFTHRAITLVGTTSEGISPNLNLDPVANSDGNALDLDVGAVLQPSRGVDVILGATLPIAGEDLQFFPIEDLQPTLGPTFHGALEVRY